MDGLLALKKEALEQRLAGLPSVVVAYSGGVDSSVLADTAHRVLGGSAVMVTAVSPSLARRELEGALNLAAERGWNYRTVVTHEVSRMEYARNEPDRCYWCKVELVDTLGPIAAELGAEIAVGTLVDDLGDYRPGLAAASERGVVTPLADAGITKAEVRELARAAGLPTADKPASPCLSSRIAYGVEVTPQRLRRIEAAEAALHALGLTELRVRDHGDIARIEVPSSAMEAVMDRRKELVERYKGLGWRYVTLDLEGFRPGSLNEVLAAPRFRSGPPAE